jgi:hypothetical protein
VSASAHSAGTYTATMYIRDVNLVKGVGVHSPPSPAGLIFSIMMECTPESGRCLCVLCGKLDRRLRKAEKERQLADRRGGGGVGEGLI